MGMPLNGKGGVELLGLDGHVFRFAGWAIISLDSRQNRRHGLKGFRIILKRRQCHQALCKNANALILG
jgi:hypothetical protein